MQSNPQVPQSQVPSINVKWFYSCRFGSLCECISVVIIAESSNERNPHPELQPTSALVAQPDNGRCQVLHSLVHIQTYIHNVQCNSTCLCDSSKAHVAIRTIKNKSNLLMSSFETLAKTYATELKHQPISTGSLKFKGLAQAYVRINLANLPRVC